MSHLERPPQHDHCELKGNGQPARSLPQTLSLDSTVPITPFPAVGSSRLSPAVLVQIPASQSRRQIRSALEAQGYDVVDSQSDEQSACLLAEKQFDAVVADAGTSLDEATAFCRRMKSSPHTRLIPILMLVDHPSLEREHSNGSYFAEEYLLKPVDPGSLLGRLRSMLRHKRVLDSLEEAETILVAFAKIIEARDTDTGDHCNRLAYYCVLLGRRLGLGPDTIRALHLGSYLHDIGKVIVPDAVLNKPGKLTESEWAIMQKHPVQGVEICRYVRNLEMVLPIIRHHHERWDGSGYPDGLSGENIPMVARILQMADIFDALTSKRSYKEALTPARALRIMRAECEKGWRDPTLMREFAALVEGETRHRPSRLPGSLGILNRRLIGL